MATLALDEDMTVPDFAAPVPSAKSKELGAELVELMSEDFNPGVDLVSSARDNMKALIGAKIEGNDFELAEAAPLPEVVDLNGQLEEAVARIQKQKKAKAKA